MPTFCRIFVGSKENLGNLFTFYCNQIVSKQIFSKAAFQETYNINPDVLDIFVNGVSAFEKFGSKLGYLFLLRTKTDLITPLRTDTVKSSGDVLELSKLFINTRFFAEMLVLFERKLCLMVVNTIDGKISMYPVAEIITRNDETQMSMFLHELLTLF